MTAPSTGAVMSTSDRIGRYFSLTSALPTTGLVLWTYALIQSGAAKGSPQISTLGPAFSPSIAKAAGLVIAVILIALFIHPLQFGMTQFLEGYWGSKRVPLMLSSIRANTYRNRIRNLIDAAGTHQYKAFEAAGLGEPAEENEDKLRDYLETESGDRIVWHAIGKQEAERKMSQFPEYMERVMPTRLGNALRQVEDSAGKQYGIDAITTAPHFSLVVPPDHAQYVRDARQQMDTTLRLCVASLVATLETIGFLLTDGPWLFVALVPYALAYVAYRGGVAAARSYGVAVATVIDLNRLALYRALNVREPSSLRDERIQNTTLMAVLQGSNEENLPFRTPPA